MPIPLTPLEPGVLSEAARKVLAAPGPLKLMAARGLTPLPRPADLATVLYQLALDADAAVRSTADRTAGELPEKILGGALADASLDPRVLGFFAGKVPPKGALIEALLLNPSTGDETIRDLAGRLDERELDLIAGNEQRLLRAPAIIGALYMNPRARMSTVDRAVELAVRNRLTVPGIPSWEQVAAAALAARPAAGAVAPGPAPATARFSGEVQEVEAVDAAFQAAAAVAVGESEEAGRKAAELASEEATAEAVERAVTQSSIAALSIPGKIRLATLGNAFARSILIRDSNKQVALAAIQSPGLTENEVVRFSANKSLGEDVIRVISNSKEFTKIYAVKLNLVNNPKCPLPTSMRLMPFLHEKDLRLLAKSKGVPSALSTQAKKLLTQKSAKS